MYVIIGGQKLVFLVTNTHDILISMHIYLFTVPLFTSFRNSCMSNTYRHYSYIQVEQQPQHTGAFPEAPRLHCYLQFGLLHPSTLKKLKQGFHLKWHPIPYIMHFLVNGSALYRE